MAILLDEASRWCNQCTLLDEAEEDEHEEICRQCRASDENKDVVLEDPYFVRLWKAVQLKRAGIPVLDLVANLDEVLAIQTIADEAEEIQLEQMQDQQEEQAEGRRRSKPQKLMQIEE